VARLRALWRSLNVPRLHASLAGKRRRLFLLRCVLSQRLILDEPRIAA